MLRQNVKFVLKDKSVLTVVRYNSFLDYRKVDPLYKFLCSISK